MSAPQVFQVRHGRVTVSDNWSGKEWCCDCREVQGLHFFAFTTSNRNLARALSLDMSKRHPWEEITLPAHLSKVRDDEIDRLIIQHKFENDPMANQDVEGVANVQSRGREAAFHKARIADAIEIKHPSFVLSTGEKIEEHSFKVVATRRRNCVVELELTAANLAWLAKATWHEWAEAGGKRKADNSELPTLTSQHCKWRKRENGWRIECKWLDAKGTERTHSKHVPLNFDDTELVNRIAEEREKQVERFYFDNHVRPQDRPEPESAPDAEAADS